MTAAALRQFMPYGAPELQDAARPNLVRALALSCAIAGVLFATAWSLSLMRGQPVIVVSPIATPRFDIAAPFEPNVLKPPPAIMPKAVIKADPARIVDAVPVPTKDTPANAERTIAGQGETVVEPVRGAIGKGATSDRGEPSDVLPPFGLFVYTDVLPEAIVQPAPVYDELARAAQVEGLVVVYVLVGKNGRVIDARVDAKKHVLLLDASALEAARRWVFSPALTNDKPVAVWVTIPFRFTLR